MTNTCVSRFWSECASRARADGTGYGLSDLGNEVAAVFREANRSWRGDPVFCGPGLIRRLTACDYEEAKGTFDELADGGYIEIIKLADEAAGKPCQIRWIGPAPI